MAHVEGGRLGGVERRGRRRRDFDLAVGRLGFAVPSGRSRTTPAMLTTHSARKRSASAKAFPGFVGMEDDLHDAVAVAQVDED